METCDKQQFFEHHNIQNIDEHVVSFVKSLCVSISPDDFDLFHHGPDVCIPFDAFVHRLHTVGDLPDGALICAAIYISRIAEIAPSVVNQLTIRRLFFTSAVLASVWLEDNVFSLSDWRLIVFETWSTRQISAMQAEVLDLLDYRLSVTFGEVQMVIDAPHFRPLNLD